MTLFNQVQPEEVEFCKADALRFLRETETSINKNTQILANDAIMKKEHGCFQR